MKYINITAYTVYPASLPLPGAWIEILCGIFGGYFVAGRSLYRERGLKFVKSKIALKDTKSLPLPGAWIEMITAYDALYYYLGRSLYRERGLKSRRCSPLFLSHCRSLYRECKLK